MHLGPLLVVTFHLGDKRCSQNKIILINVRLHDNKTTDEISLLLFTSRPQQALFYTSVSCEFCFHVEVIYLPPKKVLIVYILKATLLTCNCGVCK